MEFQAPQARSDKHPEEQNVLFVLSANLLLRECRDVMQDALVILAVLLNGIADQGPHGVRAREVVPPVLPHHRKLREVNQHAVRNRLGAGIGEDYITEGFVTHNETATASRCVSHVRPYRHSAVLAIFRRPSPVKVEAQHYLDQRV